MSGVAYYCVRLQVRNSPSVGGDTDTQGRCVWRAERERRERRGRRGEEREREEEEEEEV